MKDGTRIEAGEAWPKGKPDGWLVDQGLVVEGEPTQPEAVPEEESE